MLENEEFTLGLEPGVGLPGIGDSHGDSLLLGSERLLPTTGISLEIDDKLIAIEVFDEEVSGELGIDPLIGGNATVGANNLDVSISSNADEITLDVDHNGEIDALTDGILIVRYLFGFAGEPLIQGAVGADANRSSADEITAYLDGARDTLLDADGNGTADALTDGILIVRFLFGFTGEPLIQDAIGPGANRTTANEIEEFLEAFTTIMPPMPPVEPGNTPGEALNIGTLSSSQIFNDAVGSLDRNDYYRFTIDEIALVNLNLTGLTQAANLFVAVDFDNDGNLDNGEVIADDGIFDSSSSTSDREINRTFSPGTYWIGVFTNDADDNTGYTLEASATATPSTSTTDPGNDLSSALNIGTLSSTQSFNDAVGSLDRNDYYRFTIDEIALVNLNLTGLTQAANLFVAVDFDNDGNLDNGEVIADDGIFDSSSSTSDREINRTFSPGTYWIGVFTNDADDNTGYTLEASVI